MALLALTAACNEKISPKLLDANQSTTVPPIIEPEVYSFKVKNISPEARKFHLHLAGVGKYDTPCEIQSTDKFSSNLYRSPRKSEFDITCFFEAEELALTNNGFSFQFEASPNTCEYVGYSPFSFYNYQPGNSSGTYTMITCEAGTKDTDISGDSNIPLDALGNQVLCNKMILNDPDYPSTASLPRGLPTDETDLCMYDHSKRAVNPGPNCDVGEIIINEVNYSYTPATADDPAVLTVDPRKPRVVKCGGQVSACIQGPILVNEEGANDLTSVVSIKDTTKNQPFVDKREYPKPPRDSANLFYTNFRRNLASPHIDFGTQPLAEDVGAPTFIQYLTSFEEQRTYYPLLLENYAAGRAYNGISPLQDLNVINNVEETVGVTSYPVQKTYSYAAEAFMGLKDPKTGESFRTSPYYTFYCLDGAREIKSRIKMVVRDWDRFFSTDRTKFELMSDIFLLGNASIDNPWGVEFPGDLDPINDMNDKNDWDDTIPMIRNTPAADGSLDPAFTVWLPYNGFNHPSNFPKFKVE